MSEHPDLVLEQARSGRYTVSVAGEGGAHVLLHSRYDPETEAVRAVGSFAGCGEGLLVVLGVGLGYHLVELARRFPAVRLVAVEPRKEIFDLAKRHGPLPDRTEAGEIVFLVGLRPPLVVDRIRTIRFRQGFPPLRVFEFAPETSAFPSYFRPLVKALQDAAKAPSEGTLRYPKFVGERLRVALFDFGYFLTEEVARGLCALGHEVIRVRGSKDEMCGDVLARAARTVAERKPDFFLTINHLGFDREGILAEFFSSIEMPAASWYVDSPNLVVGAYRKNATPWVSLFVWDRGYMEKLRRAGFGQVEYLPLAADETIFKPLRLRPAAVRRLSADVGFAGNSMVAVAEEKLAALPPLLRGAARQVAEAMAPGRLSFDEALCAANGAAQYEALSPEGKADFEAAVLWRATLLYRLSCIRPLETFAPRIHGDEGWRALVSGRFRLGSPLNYYRELPAFYNACAVNFNATSRQMDKGANQRVFDVPACGGFLLTDHKEAVEELFEVNREAVTYRSPEEIPSLVSYYLRNEDRRRAVAERARERVLREHTYCKRLGRLVKAMKERYR